MKDNLDMCDLWEIVSGQEKMPAEYDVRGVESWPRREKMARILIKNSLGSRDYNKIQYARTAAEIWKTLVSLHQKTGAQGKADLIWKFWSSRCPEGASVREHIGAIRALHMEISEDGMVIEDYLLALVIAKSLPASYETYVSTIFASIPDIEEADPVFFTRKIFEEELRRENRSEDANLIVLGRESLPEEVNTAQPRRCYNCNKPGHIKDYCYAKGGGLEGQGPRQIAAKKKQEAERKRNYEKKTGQNVQTTNEDAFHTSHMALLENSSVENIHFTSYSTPRDMWIADSGASAHVANCKEMFTTYKPAKGILNVAGGLTAIIEGTGEINMESIVNGEVKSFKLMNVLYVPKTKYCLITGPKIDQAGGGITYENGSCKFWNAKGKISVTGKLIGNLYRMNVRTQVGHIPEINLAIRTSELSW